MQTSAGKVLTSVFWDVQGILSINYHEKGRTINSEYYIALLVHLKAKDKSFYKKGIERLEKCWNQCITPKGDNVDE